MIYWKVTNVKHEKEHSLLLTFYNGVRKRIDLKPYLNGPIFQPLLDVEYFKQVKIEGSSIAWSNGADFAPEFLYDNGVDISSHENKQEA